MDRIQKTVAGGTCPVEQFYCQKNVWSGMAMQCLAGGKIELLKFKYDGYLN